MDRINRVKDLIDYRLLVIEVKVLRQHNVDLIAEVKRLRKELRQQDKLSTELLRLRGLLERLKSEHVVLWCDLRTLFEAGACPEHPVRAPEKDCPTCTVSAIVRRHLAERWKLADASAGVRLEPRSSERCDCGHPSAARIGCQGCGASFCPSCYTGHVAGRTPCAGGAGVREIQ